MGYVRLRLIGLRGIDIVRIWGRVRVVGRLSKGLG